MTFNAMTEHYEEITTKKSRFVESQRCSPASASRETPSRMVCMPTMSGTTMSAGVFPARLPPL